MKKAEVLPKVLNGEPLMIVEYRSSNAETIPWRDKETGRAINLNLLSHNVEAGTRTIRVSERVPEGTDLTKYEAPFKRGQLCVLHLEEFGREKGSFTARGKMELLFD